MAARRRADDDEFDDEPSARGNRRESKRSREKVFLDDGRSFVSTTRIDLNATVYATANVTSVRLRRNNRTKMKVIKWGLTAGILGAVAALATGNELWWMASAIGGVVFVLGLAWPAYYHVILGTAGSEKTAWVTNKRKYADELASAIEEAILARG